MILPSQRRIEITLAKLQAAGRIGPDSKLTVEQMREALQGAQPGSSLAKTYKHAMRRRLLEQRLSQR